MRGVKDPSHRLPEPSPGPAQGIEGHGSILDGAEEPTFWAAKRRTGGEASDARAPGLGTGGRRGPDGARLFAGPAERRADVAGGVEPAGNRPVDRVRPPRHAASIRDPPVPDPSATGRGD